MPLEVRDDIRLAAKGMIRNYGSSAPREAKRIAERMGTKRSEGRGFWLSVIREIDVLLQRSYLCVDQLPVVQTCESSNTVITAGYERR